MMIMFLLLWFFYIFMFSSFHLLIIMIFIEYMVMFGFFLLIFSGVSFVSSLGFILVGVCVGAYVVCVYVFIVRSKSSSYVLGYDLVG